jgi:hypothetical protein
MGEGNSPEERADSLATWEGVRAGSDEIPSQSAAHQRIASLRHLSDGVGLRRPSHCMIHTYTRTSLGAFWLLDAVPLCSSSYALCHGSLSTIQSIKPPLATTLAPDTLSLAGTRCLSLPPCLPACQAYPYSLRKPPALSIADGGVRFKLHSPPNGLGAIVMEQIRCPCRRVFQSTIQSPLSTRSRTRAC